MIPPEERTASLRRTKIVATLGPASSEESVIAEMIKAGVDVFRMNFSHGSHDDHRQLAANVRSAAAKVGKHVGLLGDLQGPKIRIGDLQQEPKAIAPGQKLVLTTDLDSADSEADRIHVKYTLLPDSVAAGDTLLLDDGMIRLSVIKVVDRDVHCEVVQGSVLKSRKGINRLGGGLSAPAITEKDLQDLDLAIALSLDYIAVSFPSCAGDLIPVRDALKKAGCGARVIAKIERAEVVESEDVLRDVIMASDAVMVARGDLGVEIGDAQLVGVQKQIILMARRCNRAVITATQMMESMIKQPIPTRAEVFDVANAVLDGTDAVMLSAETAMGDYPIKVVGAMADTAIGAEKQPAMHRSSFRVHREFSGVEEAIALSAIYAASHLPFISAIICLTESGTTALLASRLTSNLPIYAITRHEATCRRMALYRGVVPFCYDATNTERRVWEEATKFIVDKGFLKKGQRVAMTFGDLHGEGGSTNTVKIVEVTAE